MTASSQWTRVGKVLSRSHPRTLSRISQCYGAYGTLFSFGGAYGTLFSFHRTFSSAYGIRSWFCIKVYITGNVINFDAPIKLKC